MLEFFKKNGSEAEDLAAPFEDAFVQNLQLFERGRNELAGVGESGKEGMLEDIYFAAGRGGAVS